MIPKIEQDRVFRVILSTLEAVALALLENGASKGEVQNLMDHARYLAISEYDRRVRQHEEGH